MGRERIRERERKHTTQGGQLCCLEVVCKQFNVMLRTVGKVVKKIKFDKDDTASDSYRGKPIGM